MKVLVQDLETMCYLSANGGWVNDREHARDFLSLLPAYYFARDHTSRHFQVVLFCPEDHFCASIIAGKGIAATESKHSAAGAAAAKISHKSKKAHPKHPAAPKPALHSVNGVFLPAGFDQIRRHLN